MVAAVHLHLEKDRLLLQEVADFLELEMGPDTG